MGLSSGWRVVLKRGRNGMESEKRYNSAAVGEEKKTEGKKKEESAVGQRGVIFIRNVPRDSDASYRIVALTAAKLRLHRPKSRPPAGVMRTY